MVMMLFLALLIDLVDMLGLFHVKQLLLQQKLPSCSLINGYVDMVCHLKLCQIVIQDFRVTFGNH